MRLWESALYLSSCSAREKRTPEEVAVQYSGISLGDAIYSMLGSVGLSPKLTYDYESSALIFTVESGLDRTQ